jgi:hypothetical protein
MPNLALSNLEKNIAPKLNLHHSAYQLNEFEKNLNKEIQAKNRIKKKSEKEPNNFKKQFLKDIKKVDTRFVKKSVKEKEETNLCTTKHLNRLMVCFEENKRQLSITDIKDFTMMDNKIINDGLKFLSRFNIIKETNDRGNYFYGLQTIC